MPDQTLTLDALTRALEVRDLTDPLPGPHAMQRLLTAIHEALAARWHCQRYLYRASPLVSVTDNYDRLGFTPDAVSRDARYTRYVTARFLLRTHTSAMIPGLLRALALDPPADMLLICPGLVYRRDSIDRLHTGEPHQLDLWRIKRGRLTIADLHTMVQTVVQAAVPGSRFRVVPASHPYTTHGLQIDIAAEQEWVEIGECGLAAPAILAQAGLETTRITGLAMGLGLDRLVMLRKGIRDIRLLRAADPRIARQMLDLVPYVAVSRQPPICRDLSVAVVREMTAEELGDRIREALADRVGQLESVDILSEVPYEELPAAAHARMGMCPGQKNVLLRLVIRDPIRTLTSAEANDLRDAVYRTVHQGTRLELANA